MAVNNLDIIMEAIDFANPFDQVFLVHDRFGEEIEVPLSDVSSYVYNGTVQAIVLGSQIGAAFTILLMLLILTKTEKRRLPVFWLNTFTLLFSVISNILLCLFYTNSWYSPYARFTDDYTFVTPGARATSIAAAVFQLLVLIGIQASLVMQVHVVSITLSTWQRASLAALSIIVALVAIAFRIAQITDNITYNILRYEYNYASQWLIQARDIALTTSICFFSLIFCAKLGWSLHRRRQMGMTQFGPMQIIFIGGAQTLILPGMYPVTLSNLDFHSQKRATDERKAIFALVQFLFPTTRINSLILTVTAISLPLTSLWASAVTAKQDKGSRGPDARRGLLLASPPGGTWASSVVKKGATEGGTRQGSTGEMGRAGEDMERRVGRDLEMQDLVDG
ncbi:Pheromone P-factor receptor [Sphaceloma murrayae]|uniref:Pheromone P-factor receptor n=1 Tax=Sphaceloma murrayae TaxID=2082308 RepID=A0A2K1QYV4_9PEZI|nr:Pheromone P-factor receptor [Sphaceloma murrayae]